jgi:hypothetical protein
MRLLTVLIIFAFSATARADDLDREAINDALINIKAVKLKHDGQEGVWFPKADAEILLELVTNKLKLSLDTIDNQTIQINALKDAVNSYKESNASYAELADHNQQMFDIAMKHLPDLDPPEPSWYETPKATFVYGIIVGVGVAVGATLLAIESIEATK